MSSNLTTFFPSAGGGGGTTSSDPKSMDRLIVPSYGLHSVTGAGSSSYETLAAFWSTLNTTLSTSDPMGSYVAMPSDSQSYQTIVDLNYVGVGGGLYNVIGPNCVSGDKTCTFKITIDGTATEIAYDNIFQDFRPVLGSFLTGQINTGNQGTPAGASTTSTPGYTHYRATNTTQRGAINGFQTTREGNKLTVPTTYAGFSYIKFADTCKVEIKVTGANYTLNTSLYRNYAAALYLLN